MIKYLGSKRALLPVLAPLFAEVAPATALDLFTGTTRVAQELKRQGAHVTAVDSASYAHVLAQCYLETDAAAVDPAELGEALARLSALPDVRGYVTETFCEDARYFHPDNGRRIDAIRQGIDDLYADSPLRPVLLTSLLEAADAVDSTVGLQMAFLKTWAPRALRPLVLRAPALLPGTGRAVHADATAVLDELAPVDLAYLDPPYNQHRYFTNYHVWETLVRWDAPEHYGIACKRVDARHDHTRSAFNSRRRMPEALADLIARVQARVVIVSFSNEGFVPLDDLVAMCSVRGPVEVLAVDAKRYVGAQIGVYNPAGERVGTPGPGRNVEYILITGR